MSDLTELRNEIDSIDRQIQSLFERRMKVSEKIAAYKEEKGLPVLDAKREEEKISSLKKCASDEKTAEGIGRLYRTLFAISRECQEEKMKNDSNR
ncbi:MAG: chorismate mutase [Lachnospiraceae bacterium]|jgi:monofunctional chorismate mutase|nr:chorismate mutase [Lachnospiraceae bacterium]